MPRKFAMQHFVVNPKRKASALLEDSKPVFDVKSSAAFEHHCIVKSAFGQVDAKRIEEKRADKCDSFDMHGRSTVKIFSCISLFRR